MTEKIWTKSDWVQTFTGRAYHPLDMTEDDIVIEDVAHSLALQCRYNGHVKRHYSVAEHCVLLSYYVAPHNALWALLHDAPEAYIGDMVRPLKKHMPEFRQIDDDITAVFARKYGLEGTVIPDDVTYADIQICLNERDELLSTPPREWAIPGDPLPGVTIYGWDWKLAEKKYLNRFHELYTAKQENN